jgi:OFA family oxalate/formate antiporter-like MFS transporter
VVAAGLLCGAGWSLLGQATTVPQLYVCYALVGIGAAFVYGASVGVALKWFPDRRGLAAGIIAAGYGGGAAFFIPLFSYLIRAQGYRTAFLLSGLGQGLALIFVAQMLSYPEVVETKPAAPPAPAVRWNAAPFTTAEMLRTPAFAVLYLMFIAMATGGLLVTANAGPLQQFWHLAPAALTAAVTLGPISNAFSRITWGWYSDRAGRENAMVLAFVLQAVSLVGVATVGRTSAFWFITTLVVTFFTWGEIFSLFPALLSDYFGSQHAASNYALLYTAKGVAAIIGGGLAATLFETTGSWTASLYGSAGLALMSAALAQHLKMRPLPRKQ